MRATEIAGHLARNVDGVVRHLLPQGQRKGHEWRAGSVGGEPGESLGVHLTGEKAGVWSDFSTGEGGDLVGLWMAVRGVSLRDACTEAMAHLGLREDRLDPPPRKSYSRPTREGVARLSDAHRAWLEGERKIAPETIARYRLASHGDELMFPYLRDGELVAAKYRRLPKSFRQAADCEPSLFGWQAYAADARVALICEGELDALAWDTYGVPALSVPMGGGVGAKHSWIESEFERLALFDTIFISMDGDGPGRDAERDICERLGRERCRVVRLPAKDANECLLQDVPREDMHRFLTEARTNDPSELQDVGDFEDAIWQEYHRVDSGLKLPWPQAERVRLREGETSIWAGVNGHGKSTLLSYVTGGMAATGVPVCIASMEYRPALWMMRMNRQIAGTGQPSEAFCRHITRELRGHLKAFAVSGAAKGERILEVFRYARRRYQTKLFVIDNLTKCGFADDDYPGQKAFVEALSDFARDEQAHVAIVAHMRKGESEMQPAGKLGVKGSGGITDMVDTVLEVWRNKPKERAYAEAARLNQAVDAKHDGAPDVLLFCHKQRFNGEEPVVGLWYDKETTQYLGSPTYKPRALLQTPMARVA